MNKLKILVLTVMAAAMVAIGALAAAPSASAYPDVVGKCYVIHAVSGQVYRICP